MVRFITAWVLVEVHPNAAAFSRLAHFPKNTSSTCPVPLVMTSLSLAYSVNTHPTSLLVLKPTNQSRGGSSQNTFGEQNQAF